MTFDVRMTPQVGDDLRGIYEYIAFHLQAPINAVKQLDALEESILSLDTMPDRFQRYSEEPWYSRNLRVMPVGNYLVFFIHLIERADDCEESGVVTIIRVMYGGRDIQTQLTRFTDFNE